MICPNCKRRSPYVIEYDRYACFKCDAWTSRDCGCWDEDPPDLSSMKIFGRPCPYPKCPERPGMVELTFLQKVGVLFKMGEV
ncbi:hypothetical protein LCGC14_1224180 [marine sediment metagenome]|uniref:Uncharacterized protein n=1 Tax=marine sediment metagenome TaxID=412755 RepID=A0A0F9PET3_9ZZZZ